MDPRVPPPQILSLLAHLAIGQTFRTYVGYVSLVLGTFGNTVSILVLCRKSMRAFAPRIFCFILAISDMLSLLGAVPHDLAGYSRLGFGNSYSALTCQLSLLFTRSSGFISLWTVVGLTVDRFIAVVFPLKAKGLSTPKRILIYEAIVIIIAFGQNLDFFWTRGIQTIPAANGQNTTINCGWTSEAAQEYSTNVENPVSLVMASILPISVITALNSHIIVTVIRSRKVNKQAKSPQSRNLTIMLIALSVSKIVMTVPHLASLSIITFIMDTNNQEEVLRMGVIQQFTVSILIFGQASNFYLCCMSGSLFRQELCQMFRGPCDQTPKSNIWTETAFKTQASRVVSKASESKREDFVEDVNAIELDANPRSLD